MEEFSDSQYGVREKDASFYGNPVSLLRSVCIPDPSGIRVVRFGMKKEKTLDPRLLMSRMTEGGEGEDDRGEKARTAKGDKCRG